MKRMRRKAPPTRKRHHISGFDIRREISAKRLEALGAIALVWTQIERRIDFAMCTATGISHKLWIEISSRINGFDGKIELIKKGAEHFVGMPPDARAIIAVSLGAIAEHKRYRDGVIHAWVVNPHAEIADTVQRKGEVDETFMSQDALDGLYRRLVALSDEAGDIISAVNYWCGVSRGIEELAGANEACMRNIKEHQERRRSLPALPAFPEESPILLTTEVTSRPGGPKAESEAGATKDP